MLGMNLNEIKINNKLNFKKEDIKVKCTYRGYNLRYGLNDIC